MRQKRHAVLKRRDATGHLDPTYAADLRSRSLAGVPREPETAFLSGAKSREPLAEVLGEEFVSAATAGEDVALDALKDGCAADEGGPFVITHGCDEFARGRDPSNPKGATREPFPRTVNDNPEEPDAEDELS